MKKYRVSVWHDTRGTLIIKAKSKKEAEKKAIKELYDIGEKNIDCNDRDYGVGGVDEIK